MTTQPPTEESSVGGGRLVLVTGVTGYLGARLVIPLLEQGWRVRVLSRSPEKLDRQPWRDHVQVATGDASSAADVEAALGGVDVAYYLLHSMDGQGDFVRRDREMATTFARAAERAGVGRMVYLGGLHPEGRLSRHLASRVEVGRILLDSTVPTAVLQAAVIIGAGSASFEMLRHLADRLPAMVAPKWLRSSIQPIAVRDIVRDLVGAAALPPDVNRTFDVGGPDILTYAEMLRRFARVAGLRPRLIVTLPVLTPGLASHWVGLVTPVPAGIAKPLVGSLVHDVVCQELDITDYVPEPEGGSLGFEDAVREALAEGEPVVGRSGIAHPPVGALWPGDAVWAGPGSFRL